jgi:hypothetical protein
VIPDALADAINRAVTTEELRQALDRPIPVDERQEVTALVRWFTTRYSSAEERLMYVRLAYERWRPRRPG